MPCFDGFFLVMKGKEKGKKMVIYKVPTPLSLGGGALQGLI
jgi:hypothetical protein